jgi:succinyl-CoA synthetase beta subunit
VTWDGRRKLPVIVFSDMGGIDIEEVAEKHPEHVARVHLSTLLPFSPYKAKEAIAATGITGDDLNRLIPIVGTLVEIFLRYDLTLAEINPLGKTEDGKWLVLDGHVDLEGDARDKHAKLLEELGIGKEETREARPPTEFEIKGAQVDASDHRGVAGNVREFDGDLGLVIGAGGGSLTLFDAIRKHGGRPANYCEIGGNPSVKKACELTKLILSKPGVKKIAVMMNVVSNTRVDIVARGVIKGCVESGRDPAETIAIFRIPGAWEDDGFKILRKYGVEYCDRSVSMYDAAGRAVAKMR